MKKIAVLFLGCLFCLGAHANLLTFQGQYAIQLEEDAAIANQKVYDALKALGCPETSQQQASAACQDALTFTVWKSVRELVQTANALCQPVNCGPTEFSLNVNLSALGNALRWTSAEEFSTQHHMGNAFLSGQLNNLQSRVTAIRNGANGFSFMNNNNNQQIATYANEKTGLSSGDKNQQWSPWGGFLNGSFSWGNLEGSQFEAAYDFNTASINGGFDYRINDTWVLGTTFATTEDKIDFDSSKSVVDGNVKMNAYSLIPFALYQSTQWYFLTSLGYQYSQFDTRRSIRYNSGTLSIPDTNTTAVSSNNAHTYLANASAGYTWSPQSHPQFSIEPSIGINYEKTNIEQFKEKDLKNDGFNFIIAEQNFDSLKSIIGLRIQYIFTPSHGVFVPFIEAQQHAQFEKDPHEINASYANLNTSLNSSQFSLLTNAPEAVYSVYTIGTSFVIQGAQQRSIDGPARGGLQGFVSASTMQNIKNYKQNTISGGLRYEF